MPCFKKLSSISEKGIFFKCALLTVSVPTFVLPIEPSEILLLALLSVPKIIKFVADHDALLS